MCDNQIFKDIRDHMILKVNPTDQDIHDNLMYIKSMLHYGTFAAFDPNEVEQLFVDVLKSIGPDNVIDRADYDVIYNMDMWQDEYGEDDNPEFDALVQDLLGDMYRVLDITYELVFLGMTESEAEQSNSQKTIEPNLPESDRVYHLLDSIPDNLCISKKLGWEKKIVFSRSNIKKIFDYLYPDGTDYEYDVASTLIDGDEIVLYGYGD